MAVFDFIFSSIQYLLPQHLLSRIVHYLMRIRIKLVKNLQIWIIGWLAGVSWEEAESPHADDYPDFNTFFTRQLKSGSQVGRVVNGLCLQAKGQHFSVRSLLANDASANEFAGGHFHTIYLAPRDYHRVHMPVSGTLQRMIHVPGRLFSVSPGTVRHVPNLFARNERVVSVFATQHGPMAVILVGALLVSSMETVWAGTITPPRGLRVSSGDWSRRNISLQKGEELGRFNMGSTVILLLTAGAVASLAELGPDDSVLMGEKLGRLR
jgi:phosphatidylserine decarboxylase